MVPKLRVRGPQGEAKESRNSDSFCATRGVSTQHDQTGRLTPETLARNPEIGPKCGGRSELSVNLAWIRGLRGAGREAGKALTSRSIRSSYGSVEIVCLLGELATGMKVRMDPSRHNALGRRESFRQGARADALRRPAVPNEPTPLSRRPPRDAPRRRRPWHHRPRCRARSAADLPGDLRHPFIARRSACPRGISANLCPSRHATRPGGGDRSPGSRAWVAALRLDRAATTISPLGPAAARCPAPRSGSRPRSSSTSTEGRSPL